MKTCFSEGKLMKQFGNPPLSKRTPPFQLTPLFLSNFFMTPLFVQISKTKTPPSLPPNFRGEGTIYIYISDYPNFSFNSKLKAIEKHEKHQ